MRTRRRIARPRRGSLPQISQARTPSCLRAWVHYARKFGGHHTQLATPGPECDALVMLLGVLRASPDPISDVRPKATRRTQNTGGGNRTHTGVPAQRILSPQRLPFRQASDSSDMSPAIGALAVLEAIVPLYQRCAVLLERERYASSPDQVNQSFGHRTLPSWSRVRAPTEDPERSRRAQRDL